MKKVFTIISSIVLISMVCACNVPNKLVSSETPTEAFEAKVAMTLTAISQNKPIPPSETPIPASPTEPVAPTITFTPTFTVEPSVTPTLTRTQAPSQTPIPKPGTIAGGISGYPYGALPSLAIVAYEQEPPYNYSYWITAPGDTYYSMSSNYLIPGKYLVVAYDAAGNSGGCTSLVEVKSEETSNCSITDWAGSYPSKPAGVPNP